MSDGAHNDASFAKSIRDNPKEYGLWKNGLTTVINESLSKTVNTLRPNYETIKQQNQLLVSKLLS